MGRKTINWPIGDEITERTGSIIHWDTVSITPHKKRGRRTVLITCGKCKKRRRAMIFNVRKLIENNKWGYTGYCLPCQKSMTWDEKFGRNKMAEGTKWMDKRGYVLVYYPDNPMAHKQGYVYEHRYVMSQKLGRPLESWEHVHHKNGNKSDNRDENLKLYPNSEHLAIRRMQDYIKHLESLLVKHHVPF